MDWTWNCQNTFNWSHWSNSCQENYFNFHLLLWTIKDSQQVHLQNHIRTKCAVLGRYGTNYTFPTRKKCAGLGKSGSGLESTNQLFYAFEIMAQYTFGQNIFKGIWNWKNSRWVHTWSKLTSKIGGAWTCCRCTISSNIEEEHPAPAPNWCQRSILWVHFLFLSQIQPGAMVNRVFSIRHLSTWSAVIG